MSDAAHAWLDSSIELSSSRLGAKTLFATDEWFAICDNLLKPALPAFDPTAFCSEGKVMDGWESRRRVSSYHICVILLLLLLLVAP